MSQAALLELARVYQPPAKQQPQSCEPHILGLNSKWYRHAPQQEYGNPNSEVREDGLLLPREAAWVYAHELYRRQRNGVLVVPSYSPRPRTQQSAEIFHEEVQRVIELEQMQNIVLLDPQPDDLLSPENTLTPVNKLLGIPMKEAYSFWIDPENESRLAEHAITLPRDIYYNLMAQFLEVYEIMAKLTHGEAVQKGAVLSNPEIDIIGWTHETTIGAFASKHFPQREPIIGYCEQLALRTHGPSNGFKFFFRGGNARAHI